MEAQEEQRLVRGQKDYLEIEVRKFKRKKLLSYHLFEQQLLGEVSNLDRRSTESVKTEVRMRYLKLLTNGSFEDSLPLWMNSSSHYYCFFFLTRK